MKSETCFKNNYKNKHLQSVFEFIPLLVLIHILIVLHISETDQVFIVCFHLTLLDIRYV